MGFVMQQLCMEWINALYLDGFNQGCMGLVKKTHICERATGYQNGMLDEESIWLFYKMK